MFLGLLGLVSIGSFITATYYAFCHQPYECLGWFMVASFLVGVIKALEGMD